MATKQQKQIPIVDFVDLSSSDGEEDEPVLSQHCNASHKNPLANRSFWRAGDYEIRSIKSTKLQDGLEHARVHPKFLHSNATSHRWAFGAIAELLDNAVDEIGNGATFVKVDKLYDVKENSPALLFQDDGGGMDPDSIRKCMSLGYTSKTSNTTIGQYGNGFKTSTMRLGADVIVFSRAARSGRLTQSIGLLSYTFLRKTGLDDVIVPMIDFDISNNEVSPIIYGSKDDWSNNLKSIIEWSPFSSKKDLMLQFDNIGSHGTKIIIYNLWMNDDGIYELNFDNDEEDIRLRDEVSHGNVKKASKKELERQSHLSYRIRYSLRAYASILYLRKFTNFRIFLRGKPVEQFSICDDLRHSKTITYKPHVGLSQKEVTLDTKIGFNKEAPALRVCGFNVYHKNRLIRPYWKVMPDGTSKGNCVVGVLEANFIEPAHDKQDFERSNLFIKLEARLKQMVKDYWKSHCHLIGLLATNESPKNVDAHAQVEKANADSRRTRVDDESIFNEIIVDAEAGSCPDSSLNATRDRIREENIQLFMRCEELKSKQAEKLRKIEELEKELEQMMFKSANARISSYLEAHRKRMAGQEKI